MKIAGSAASGGTFSNDGRAEYREPNDPDLAAVLDAWPELPEAIKAGIMAMVRAARR